MWKEASEEPLPIRTKLPNIFPLLWAFVMMMVVVVEAAKTLTFPFDKV